MDSSGIGRDLIQYLQDLDTVGGQDVRAVDVVVDSGTSVTEAARTLKIGRSTAYAALAAPRESGA